MEARLYRSTASDARNLGTSDFSMFVGGQLDIRNETEDYHFRAVIQEVEIVGVQGHSSIRAVFSRVFQDRGGSWVEVATRPYFIGLGILRPTERTDDRFVLETLIETENLTFFTATSAQCISVG